MNDIGIDVIVVLPLIKEMTGNIIMWKIMAKVHISAGSVFQKVTFSNVNCMAAFVTVGLGLALNLLEN
jgi:hypothetical protein